MALYQRITEPEKPAEIVKETPKVEETPKPAEEKPVKAKTAKTTAKKRK